MSDKRSLFTETKEMFEKRMKERKLEKVKFKWKRSAIMVGCGIVLYFMLKLILTLDFKYSFVIWFIYEGIAALSVISYVIVMRGDLSPKPPLETDLPADWTVTQKADYIELNLKRREFGKRFLYIAIPFIFAVMAAILSEIWWPAVSGGGLF